MIPFRYADTDVSGVRDCILRLSPCDRFRDLYVYRANRSSKLCIVVDEVFTIQVKRTRFGTVKSGCWIICKFIPAVRIHYDMYFISFSRCKRIRCRHLSSIMIPFRHADTDVSGVRYCILRMSPCDRLRDRHIHSVNALRFDSQPLCRIRYGCHVNSSIAVCIITVCTQHI